MRVTFEKDCYFVSLTNIIKRIPLRNLCNVTIFRGQITQKVLP